MGTERQSILGDSPKRNGSPHGKNKAATSPIPSHEICKFYIQETLDVVESSANGPFPGWCERKCFKRKLSGPGVKV